MALTSALGQILSSHSMVGIFLDLNRKYHLGAHHLKPDMSNFILRVDLYEKRANRRVHGQGDSGAVWVRAQDHPHVRCLVPPLLPGLVSAQWAGRELLLFLPRTLINLLNEFIPSECVPEN